MSIGEDGREVLIPTVSDDGRIMNDNEAIQAYRSTGRHLGKFDSPDNATAYAEALHEQQAQQYVPTQKGGMRDFDTNVGKAAGGTYEKVAPTSDATKLVEDPSYGAWLNQSVIDGTREYAPDQDVPIISKDGEGYYVKGADVKNVINTGTARIMSPVEEVKYHIRGQEKDALGGVKAFSAGGLDAMTLGVSDVVLDHVLSPQEKYALEVAKEEHSGAHFAGELTGTVASLFYGGPLLKAASKAGTVIRAGVGLGNATSIAGKAAGAAIQLGTEGALFATPKAGMQLIFGDADDAAETLGWSAGIGAMLGGSGSLLGSTAKRLIPPDAVANWLERQANQRAFKSLNISSNQSLTRKIGDSPLTDVEQVGARLLDEDSKLMRGVGEEWKDYSKRLAGEQKVAGKEIGKLYKDLDNIVGTPRFDRDSIATRFDNEVLRPLEQTFGAESEEAMVKKQLESFLTKTKNELTFEELHNIRKTLDDKIYRNRVPGKPLNPIQQELKAMRDIVTDELVTKGEAAAQAAGDEFKNKLSAANKKFVELKFAQEGAKESATRSISNRTNSLTDYVNGNAISNVAGVMSGLASNSLPGGLVAGMVANSVGKQINKFGREHGNTIAAKVLKNLSGSIRTANQKLMSVSPTIDAMKQGAKAIAVIAPVTLADTSKVLGTDGKKSHTQQILEFQDKLIKAQSPEHAADLGGKIGKELDEAGLSYAQDGLQAQLLKTAQYLQQYLPKPRASQGPFQASQPYIPDAEILSYLKRVETARNPFSVIDKLKDNTLGKEELETINALYPKAKDKIAQLINYKSMTDPGLVVAPKYNSKLTMMLGTPIASFANQDRAKALSGIYGGPVSGQQVTKSGASSIKPQQTTVARLTGG
jgi:hypothetical protein